MAVSLAKCCVLELTSLVAFNPARTPEIGRKGQRAIVLVLCVLSLLLSSCATRLAVVRGSCLALETLMPRVLILTRFPVRGKRPFFCRCTRTGSCAIMAIGHIL